MLYIYLICKRACVVIHYFYYKKWEASQDFHVCCSVGIIASRKLLPGILCRNVFHTRRARTSSFAGHPVSCGVCLIHFRTVSGIPCSFTPYSMLISTGASTNGTGWRSKEFTSNWGSWNCLQSSICSSSGAAAPLPRSPWPRRTKPMSSSERSAETPRKKKKRVQITLIEGDVWKVCRFCLCHRFKLLTYSTAPAGHEWRVEKKDCAVNARCVVFLQKRKGNLQFVCLTCHRMDIAKFSLIATGSLQ